MLVAPFVGVPRRASPDTISSHEPSTNEHARAGSSAGPNAIPSFSSVDRATKQIHVVFTEFELACEYASVEALAAHPKIADFVKWITRQPPTADIPVRRKRA